jgi:hypothetical protein
MTLTGVDLQACGSGGVSVPESVDLMECGTASEAGLGVRCGALSGETGVAWLFFSVRRRRLVHRRGLRLGSRGIRAPGWLGLHSAHLERDLAELLFFPFGHFGRPLYFEI